MNKQSGFTLIEIVMVLVLLGILSAVAVPKYFDLQKQAEEKAAQAIGAEYQAQLNAQFAKAILNGNTTCKSAIEEAIKQVKETSPVKLNSDNFSVDTSALTATATGSVNLVIKGKSASVDFPIAIPDCAATNN